MSFAAPPHRLIFGFELDQSSWLENLQSEPAAMLDTAWDRVSKLPFSRIISNLATPLLESAGKKDDFFAEQAFDCAAALAVVLFSESNLPLDLRSDTIDIFKLGRYPLALLLNDKCDRQSGYRQLAKSTFEAFPELQATDGLLARYYSEIASDQSNALLATCGLGIVAHRLASSFESVRLARIKQLCIAEKQLFDLELSLLFGEPNEG